MYQNEIASFHILDSVPSGIFVIDNTYSLVYWNLAMNNLNSEFNSQNENKNIFQLFPNLKNPLYQLRIETVLEGGPPTIFSSQFHKYLIPCEIMDGNFRVQHTTVNGFTFPATSNKYLIFSIQDVTTETKQIAEVKLMRDKAYAEIQVRKEVEEKLREIQKKLKEEIAKKDKFFSIISHDLRSPFTAILGISEMLYDERKNPDPEFLEEALDSLNSAAKGVYGLLEGLLEWARSQTGRLEFEPKEFNISEEANKVLGILRPGAFRKGVSLLSELDNRLSVFADLNMITTVIRNLVANSIKFTNRNGSVKVTITKREEDLLFAITDTGIGMKEKDIQKLFKIDVHHTTIGTGQETGTGLGLILCKEFIEKHNGKIWVESEFGKGSSFYFSLPQKN